ncbi:MAG TPA: AsmA-like C-terminal region-containing protein, partial [Flavobacterium sp.]|nr:AsmA-like C-terminal region-containing protein [Flavobacterium sp.]
TGISLKNASINHAGGSLSLNGFLANGKNSSRFSVDAAIQNVDIEKFFYAFDNFGMQSLSSKNLKGYLFSKASLKGSLGNNGKLDRNSMSGTADFDLKKGALVNFAPIKSAGRLAFPFRDLDNITFASLNGKFDIAGEKIKIHPMKINSSLLNMDVAGIYSFGKGTSIVLDVPLRNPKKDKGITDQKELEERRNKGIVLHLLASDDEKGNVKIKLVSKKTSAAARQ